ncbi:hypothetical protein [Sphingosinicella rhizophila]|uniref:Uncharacterized protein n=1 Tax=Sphingosinicella rhizophila TaxID=3050082 RepID=A0ABU3Q7Q7_9SPHN|nr:hypothetical protein [Sphingosinicella sp. GR2756]MDT9599327.1 hypothetical protein [Sphingosinicella sp. GR2756]
MFVGDQWGGGDMRAEADAMKVVQAELCGRLEALQALPEGLPLRIFAENVEGIKRLATAYGLAPVERLAVALERCLGENPAVRSCLSTLYLERLGDAIGCDRRDDLASEAMIASVAVRLGA